VRRLPPVEISFDPVKSERNRRERGLPFERAVDFDFGTAMIRPTFRNGEERREALGYLDDRLHLLCYKRIAEDHVRVISFRRANEREAKRYGAALRR